MVYSLYLFSGALPFTWNFHHVFHSLETSFPFTWNLYHVFKWSLMCHGYLPKPYEFKQDSKFAEWSFYSSCTFKDCVNSLVQCGLLAHNSNALDYLLESSLMCTYILYTISWVYFLLYHSNFLSFLYFIDIIFHLENVIILRSFITYVSILKF